MAPEPSQEAPSQFNIQSRVVQEDNESVLEFNCFNVPFFAPLEDSDVWMAKIIYSLMQYREVTQIRLAERRIYEYDRNQTKMLKEIAEVVRYVRASQELYNPYAMSTFGQDPRIPERFQFLQMLVMGVLPRDPIGAYVELTRRIRREEIEASKETQQAYKQGREHFIRNVLSVVKGYLDQTSLIKAASPYFEGYQTGDRVVYHMIFRPTYRPNFTFTKLMAEIPAGAQQLDSYVVRDSVVTIFRLPGEVRPVYHIMPPEFKLTDEEFQILDYARDVMAQHKPTTAELIDPARVRLSLHDVAFDLIREYAARIGLAIKPTENEKLAEIITRETAGFGILELVLSDEHVQDIAINAPTSTSPIQVVHSDFEDCQSNVLPTLDEVSSWAARLRLFSGRPLDTSNPVLDTSIEIPGSRARVAAVSPSLSPYGLAFSFRRHRERPWTLPLFIKNRALTPLAAGLISFLVDGGRTILVAGTRGSGKTSILAAMMCEVMRSNRIITVEDTLELPTQTFAELKYNIQSLKVQSAIVQVGNELSAADGIRTSLRLGDSCLIIGEVRSKEALALYEAMRVGALANVVAGTIHGDSPYGVYDRVVNDLGVPKTSFKATDIILVANPIRSADGLHRVRRVVQLTEVRKHWEEDPIKEKGFVDLLEYEAKDDELKPTQTLIDGESEILSMIAARVREWVGNFDAVWDNITMRTKMKKAIVDYATSSGNPNVLEAPFVIASNDAFHLFSEQVKKQHGSLVSEYIYEKWDAWVREQIKAGRV
ncbi:MAG: type II/IV secretion system ATPase subunit [archaeon]